MNRKLEEHKQKAKSNHHHIASKHPLETTHVTAIKIEPRDAEPSLREKKSSMAAAAPEMQESRHHVLPPTLLQREEPQPIVMMDREPEYNAFELLLEASKLVEKQSHVIQVGQQSSNTTILIPEEV